MEIPNGVQEGENLPGVLAIGWAQGTTHSTSSEDVRGWLAEEFGPVKLRENGLQWYRRAWSIGEAGVVVADSPRSSSSAPSEVYVVVPQGALEPLGWSGQLRVLALLESIGVRLSRCDVSYDDRARLADPEDVWAALKRGDVLTHVRYFKRVEDTAGGMTVYLGARTAECMVRVYRKWAESGDPTQGVRWEMEAKGERAPIVADLVRLAGLPAGLPTGLPAGLPASSPASTFFGLLRAHVDFVDTSEGVRSDRAPLLGWWSGLIGSAERAVLVKEKRVESITRTVRWWRRQVVPSAALLYQAFGSGFMSDLIAEGYSRMRRELLPSTG